MDRTFLSVSGRFSFPETEKESNVFQNLFWSFFGFATTLRKMFGWIKQIVVGSNIEYGYYTDNQIFGWPKKIFWLIKFGWLYQLFWLIQPNTMVNLKKCFCSRK